jgi:hypothetical protein
MLRMRRMHYAGGSILLGDQTCKAVIRLARALAMKNRSDIIEFPVVEPGGVAGTAHLLIGPSSEISSVPVPGAEEGPDDQQVVADLEMRTAGLQPRRPSWEDEMGDVPNFDWNTVWVP